MQKKSAIKIAIRALLLQTLLLSSVLASIGQDLRDHSEHYLIFKHDLRSFEKLAKDPSLIHLNEYQSDRIGFVHRDSLNVFVKQHLKPGQYTLLSINKNLLKIEYLVHSGLIIALQSFGNKPGLRIWNKEGEFVSDALVRHKRKKLTADTEIQAYMLKNFIQSGKIRVEKNGVTEKLTLHYKMPKWSSDYSGYSPAPCYDVGFAVVSQPVYRHGDTLKVKAFLSECSGKPLSYSAIFKVEYDNRKIVWQDTIQPVSDGAYVVERVLPDSLKLDKSYTINFIPLDAKGMNTYGYQLQKSIKFKLEDYELKEAVMNLNSVRTLYHREQPVDLRFEAADKNGQPMMDATAEIIVTNASVENVYERKLIIPDTLFVHTYTMDETGTLLITIPDSSIRFPADQHIHIRAFLRNSSNETIEKTINVRLLHQDLEFKIEVLRDTVYLNALNSYKGKVVMQQTSQLIEQTDTLVLPAKFKVNATTESYYFRSENQTEKLNVVNLNNGIKILSNTIKDSIEIKVDNPYGIIMSAFVRHRGERFLLNTDSTVAYKFPVKSHEKMSVYVQYLWAGKAQQGVSDYQLFEKRLFIETNLPEITFPGKSTTIEIKVKDYLDKPVTNANLTVMSYNDQFKENIMPYIPDYGFKAAPTKLPSDQSLSICSYPSKMQIITNYWVQEFKLQYSVYYRALLTGESGLMYSLPLDTEDYPQLAIYAVLHKKFIEPAYVEIDGKPAWYHKAITPYGLIATEGYHKVRLRFREFDLTIDSVCTEWERKTIVAVNLDSLPSYAEKKARNIYFSQTEINSINKYFIPLLSDNNNGKTLAVSNRRFYFFNNNKSSAFWIGPLYPNDMKLFSSYKDSIEFKYEPGMSHHVKKNVIMVHGLETPNTKDAVYHDFGSWNINLKDRAFNTIERDLFLKKPLYEFDERNFTKPEQTYTDHNLGRIKVFTELSGALATVIYCETDKSQNRLYKGMITEFNNLKPGHYAVRYYFDDFSFMSLRIESYPNVLSVIKINIEDLTDSIYLKEVEKVFGFKTETKNTGYSSSYSISKNAESNYNAEISGRITDENNEAIPFANVVILKDGAIITGSTTDLDGFYSIKPIDPGKYDVEVSVVGYSTSLTKDVSVSTDRITTLNVKVKGGIELDVVEVVWSRPLIDAESNSSRKTFDQKEIAIMPTRNVSSIASTTAGVYRGDEGQHLNIKGARNEETEYYIDGIRVSGSTNLPAPSIEELTVITGGVPASFGNISGGIIDFTYKQDKFDVLPMDASGIRTVFSDNAIWQPNLLTDSLGTASFNMKWPDNITRWKTAVIAVNDKIQTGKQIIYTKAYKPVQAILALPRFMIEGDSAEAVCKMMNYTGFDYNLKAIYESYITRDIDTTVRSSATWRFPFVSGSDDSAKATFSITLPNGYKDGETRSVPIFQKGLVRHEGALSYLLTDTSFTIKPISAEHPAELRIQNQVDDIIKSEVDYLRGYIHTCNEQMASRLKGLLTMKYLDDEDEWKKRDEREVRKLISKLEDNQTREGGWSWWGKDNMNPFITLQVGEALLLAREQNYMVKSLEKLQGNIEKLIEKATEQDERLHLLYMASQLKAQLLYVQHIDKIEKDTLLTTYQKILLLRIKQLASIPHNPYECFLYLKTTLYGNMYACEENRHLFNNSLYATSLAYEIVRDAYLNKDTLARILGYMFEKHPGNHFHNTIISSRIIRLLFDESKKQVNSNSSVTITSNTDSETVNKFPMVKTLAAGEAATLKVNTNRPLFINWHQNFYDNNPVSKTQYFTVQSELIQQGKSVTELKASYPALLKVIIQVKFHSEYMILNIPVPAGCSMEKSEKESFEVHREYFRDRVSIYFESLPEGTYTYNVHIIPRFNGTYTLNPAHIEHMYFPQFEGFNNIKRLKIF